MEKPTIIYDSKGPSGNIFHILGMVAREMKKQKRASDYNILRDKVYLCSSHAKALEVIGEYVVLVDMADSQN